MSKFFHAAFVLVVAAFVALSGSLVYAEGLTLPILDGVQNQLHDLAGDLSGQVSLQIDSVLQKDIEIKNNADIWKKFGIDFHPHMRVCADATGDTAHCNARVLTNEKGVPAATTSPYGYTPYQLLKAYNLTGVANGRPIIAIVDAYDDKNIAADLNTFSNAFGIPTLPTCSGSIASSPVPCFKKVNQKGGTTMPFQDAGWALEISLDVETAHALCQNCSILLVEANSASFSNLMAAVDQAVAQGASVVSNSYGASEFGSETAYDYHFNRPGVAFTVSAGDAGYGVEYPAASKYVTAVGGTSLFLNADGSYNSESTWSGTGSGCSRYEGKPSFQTDPTCTKRMVADVSAVADPNTGMAVYDSVSYYGQRGWFEVGGTSLSAPIIASVYALSGNIPANTQENSLPYLNNPAINLHDVFMGSNGSCSGTYYCTAKVGYDGPTGLGTPFGVAAF